MIIHLLKRANKFYLSIFVVLLVAANITALGYKANTPVLPADMRIPDGMGMQIQPPKLSMRGNPLVVSNSPEVITGLSGPSALYRTTIDKNRFRLFFHHQNAARYSMKIGAAITCPSSSTGNVEVYLARNSQKLPNENANTAHIDPATAGMIAMRNWFVSRPGKPNDSYLCTLAPGKSYYLLQNVPAGQTLTGMYDFATKYKEDNAQSPKLIITMLACADLPADPSVLPILPPDSGNMYRRGTFAHSERSGRIVCDTSQVRWLDLAGPDTGRHARLMPNEMERAIDDPRGWNPGNYGVVYNLRVDVRNSASSNLSERCLLSAAGGPGYSGVTLNGKYKENAKLLGSYECWTVHNVQVDPDKVASFNLEFTLPGGSSGAHRLFLWPES